ncbi:hypothetical protein BU17DRAFT_94672 [Hysterangium stoloniferum]|nr:hypothetical protein BU17DRAFT_94672 [Hysterangium stoloniferum]
MSNRSQLPLIPNGLQPCSLLTNRQPRLLRTVTRRTPLENERMQDREVLEDSNVALILEGIQSAAKKFDLPLAIALLSQIAETADPPLLPALNNRRDVRKCIIENTELFDLLGECLQKESFSEIRSLEILQPKSFKPPRLEKEFNRLSQDPESSGTGKSRMISELGRNNVFVVHMTLRDTTDKGFPPQDDILANSFSAENANDSTQYETRCSAFFASLFKTLESTIQEICTRKHDGRSQITFSQCVKAWQEFGSFVPMREDFFAKVYNTFDDMRNLSLSDNSVVRRNMTPGSGRKPAKDAGLTFSGKEKMMDAYKSLVDFIKGLLPKATPSGTDPEIKVMLGFDEAAILQDEQGSQDEKYIPVDIICRATSICSHADRYPIWAIFASTNSRVADFAAPTKIQLYIDVGRSIFVGIGGGELLFRPFPELGFNQSAPKFSLDFTSWPVLNNINHISGVGHPLWCMTNACTLISELVAVAKQKLMLAHDYDKTKEASSLALVSQRFALDVVFGHPETVNYVERSVAKPLLSHAAVDVMWESEQILPNVFFHLKNKIESGIIDVDKNGELVCRLLLLFVKDHYLSRSWTGMAITDTPKVEDGHLRYCSAIPVNEWLTKLFGERASTDVEQKRQARQTFNYYEVNFSHWISMKQQIAPFDGWVSADELAKRLYFHTCAKGTNNFSHFCISTFLIKIEGHGTTWMFPISKGLENGLLRRTTLPPAGAPELDGLRSEPPWRSSCAGMGGSGMCDSDSLWA